MRRHVKAFDPHNQLTTDDRPIIISFQNRLVSIISHFNARVEFRLFSFDLDSFIIPLRLTIRF